jgi:alternate signal-mediated exported protein
MRRIVAGVVALLGAVVLCTAAPSSMAYWQASVEIQEMSFETGSLVVTAEPGSWTGSPIDDGRGAVPGDQIVYEKTMTIERSGTFPVRITLGPGAVSRLDVFAASGADVLGDGVSPDPDEDLVWLLDDGVSSTTVTVRLAYTWEHGQTLDNTTQDISLTIDDGTLLVFQDARSA